LTVNAAAICDGAVTVDGWLDNPTATVTLTVVVGSGNANSYGGLVERTGRYWVENVPLSPGTNIFTLSVADGWGNSTMNNFTVVQSAMQLSGIGVQQPSELFQPTAIVSGLSSDAVTAVTVNGVAAVMAPGGGLWTATNVPNNDLGNGTVRFGVLAQDAETNRAGFTVDFVKPDLIYVSNYTCWQTNDYYWLENFYDGRNFEILWGFQEESNTSAYALNWTNGLPATGLTWMDAYEAYADPNSGTNAGYDYHLEQDSWPAAWYPLLQPGSSLTSGDWYPYGDGAGVALAPALPWEHCVESTSSSQYARYYGDDFWTDENDQRSQRTADTTLNYYTGGRASPGVLGLVEFHVSAWSPGGSTNAVPPQSIVIGALGQVGSDGVLWKLLPNATNVDITPRVPGNNNYTFNVTATNHALTLTANGSNILNQVPEFCVGQQVTLAASWNPPLPPGTQSAQSWVPGGSIIDQVAPPLFDGASPQYNLVLSLLRNNPVPVWWYDGGNVDIWFPTTNFMPNGQVVSIHGHGCVSIFQPFMSDFALDNNIVILLNASSAPSITLELGNLSGNGMGWQWTANMNTNFTGMLSFVQLINRRWSWDRSVWYGHLAESSTTRGGYWLDNQDPYGSGSIVNTAGIHRPQVPLRFGDSPSLNDNLYSFADLSDDFQTYVQFQPNSSGGIPVTIGCVNWSWHARTDGANGAWALTASNITVTNLATGGPPAKWPSTYHNTGN
jgi:hypothetical protein